jgi:ubiquinone/menaquinone biosynthesis C-methylase UbiE
LKCRRRLRKCLTYWRTRFPDFLSPFGNSRLELTFGEGPLQTRKRRFIEVRGSKDDLRRIYARLSRIYDLWGFFMESKAAARALELAGIRDGESILEVAVGTGAMFERIVGLNPNGENEGIDLSRKMLAAAGKRLHKHFSNYTLRVGDAYSLPYPEATFDLIVNNYMFDLLPEEDFGQVLLEFKRVLKTKGRMVITTMTPGPKWYNRIWDWLLHRAPWLLTGCRPVSLEQDIERSGFTKVHSEYVSQLTFPSLVIYAERN